MGLHESAMLMNLYYNKKINFILNYILVQACEKKQWSLVRHTAGLLQKRVEDLAEVSNSICGY